MPPPSRGSTPAWGARGTTTAFAATGRASTFDGTRGHAAASSRGGRAAGDGNTQISRGRGNGARRSSLRGRGVQTGRTRGAVDRHRESSPDTGPPPPSSKAPAAQRDPMKTENRTAYMKYMSDLFQKVRFKLACDARQLAGNHRAHLELNSYRLLKDEGRPTAGLLRMSDQ